VIYELSEILDQTQKKTHVVHVFGGWQRLNGLNFHGIGTDAPLINDMPQVLDFSPSKTGFSLTDVELLACKHFEDQAHMRLMLSFSLTKNHDVVYADNNKLSDVRMKNKIPHRLKSGWGVSQASISILNRYDKREFGTPFSANPPQKSESDDNPKSNPTT
jgi:hypothetical protein